MRGINKKGSNGITLIVLVITIVVLLILAGISIAAISGDNGIVNEAISAKEKSKKAEVEEIVDLILREWKGEKYGKTNDRTFKEFLDSKVPDKLDAVIDNKDGTFTVEKDGYEIQVSDKGKIVEEISKSKGIRPKVQVELVQENGEPLDETVSFETAILVVNVTNEADIIAANGSITTKTVKDKNNAELPKTTAGDKTGYSVNKAETYTVTVISTVEGISKETTIEVTIKAVPEFWKATTEDDTEWYGYTDIGTTRKVRVNAPKLKGQMTPIKYVGETQDGSKWANAITADGSMWVWIPRYAYKITEGYHSANVGKIEVAFINTNNQFLNKDIDSGEITENPAETGAGQTKWLVHPAFTGNAASGGGFGNLEGLWIGKFEATETGIVKPSTPSLKAGNINDQFKAAQKAKYGEKVNLGSHMAKNSEWGVTVYLAHSKYGTNGQEIEKNGNFLTGSSITKETVYKERRKQSTTHNATGVYDLNGGAAEYVAAYLNTEDTKLEINGGTNAEDLYGADETERRKSTKYKTVYPYIDEKTPKKGDAIYETSGYVEPTEGDFGSGGFYAWFGTCANMPTLDYPFFGRGGFYDEYEYWTGVFYFTGNDGTRVNGDSGGFRPVLAF